MTDTFEDRLVEAYGALEEAQADAPLTVSYELLEARASVERCMEKLRECED